MSDRRHPLPWSILNDWVKLEGSTRTGEEDRPYCLSLGRYGSVMASLTANELNALRLQIDAVLDAPHRVLILGGEIGSAERVAEAVCRRLDTIHAQHDRMEIATRGGISPAETAAQSWAVEAMVPILTWPRVEAMVADGGSRALVVAGEGALELAQLANEAGIPIDLIRYAPEAVA